MHRNQYYNKSFFKIMNFSVTSLIYFLWMTKNIFVHGGWIDDDTPEDKRVLTSLIDGTEYQLVRWELFVQRHNLSLVIPPLFTLT